VRLDNGNPILCQSHPKAATTDDLERQASYLLQSFPNLRPARPSKGSPGKGSDALGQNPKHLEASRSIFSSQCMQNRHQALSNRCKLLFLQKTMLNQKEHNSPSIGPPIRPEAVGHRWPARPERSGVSRDSVRTQYGGAERDRTADPLLAKQVLSQLSYSPNLLGTACSRHAHTGDASKRPFINTITRTINFDCIRPIQRHHSPKQMVGPGRLELPTPRLSSVCSNQLSYGPIQSNRSCGFLSS
jgi:hypothetical protein